MQRKRAKPRPGRVTGDDLTALRAECYSRDAGLCQNCGRMTIQDAPHEWGNAYHMAHIRAKRIGLDGIDNVRVLCGMCHRYEHTGGKTVCSKIVVSHV